MCIYDRIAGQWQLVHRIRENPASNLGDVSVYRKYVLTGMSNLYHFESFGNDEDLLKARIAMAATGDGEYNEVFVMELWDEKFNLINTDVVVPGPRK